MAVDNNLEVRGSLSNLDIVKAIRDTCNKDSDTKDTSNNEPFSCPTEQSITQSIE